MEWIHFADKEVTPEISHGTQSLQLFSGEGIQPNQYGLPSEKALSSC